jgi:hypothetical protein
VAGRLEPTKGAFDARTHDKRNMRGRLTGSIGSIAALSLTVLAAAAPAAHANSLLSGYGGPGEGNQAIIGSTLINPPSGGGGGGGGGEGAGVAAGGEASAGAPSGSAGSIAGSAGGVAHARGGVAGSAGGSTGSTGGAAGSAHAGRGSSHGGAGETTLATRDLATRGPVETETLGLSGHDLVYIILTLALLALTGILTGRLAHGGSREQHPATTQRTDR